MVTCPRCGNDAEYLADDTYVLIRCAFCGDDINSAPRGVDGPWACRAFDSRGHRGRRGD
jgi:hypothetical protein